MIEKNGRLIPKKRFKFIGITFIFCMLLSSGQAIGGVTWLGTNLQTMLNLAMGKIGPFKYNAAFGIGRAGYDSDLYYGNTPEPVPDYTFSLEPSIRLFLPLSNKIVFDIIENPYYVYYLRTKRERVLNNVFGGAVHFNLEKLYFRVGGSSANTKQRVTSEVFYNLRRKTNDLIGLAFWQISQGTAIQLLQRYRTFKFEIPSDTTFDWKDLDRNETYSSLNVFLQNFKRKRFFLRAEYQAFVFQNEVLSDRNSRSYTISGGIQFVPPPGIDEQSRISRGQINLGYIKFVVLNDQRENFGGLVGDTNFLIPISRVATLQAIFTRNIQFSIFAGLNYYVQTSYGIGYNLAISRRTTFEYGFVFTRHDYPRSDEIGLEQATRKFLSHNFRLTFYLRQRLELSLIADFDQRSEDWTQRIYNHHFIGFSLSWR